jgi:hypothetical protein
MRAIQLAIVTGVLVSTCVSVEARFPRGAAPTFEGKTWNEALEKVPCQNVAKDGKDLKISGTVIVDGKSFPNPVITEGGQIKPS